MQPASIQAMEREKYFSGKMQNSFNCVQKFNLISVSESENQNHSHNDQMKSNRLRELFYNHEGKLIHKWDHYFDIYEKYFSAFVGKEINILEIGVSHGGSLQLWKKYFGEMANVYAIDINPQCKNLEEDRVKIFIGSQTDKTFLKGVAAELPALDIVLDDGGHTMEQQIVSFESLFLKLKEGGLYMVEDTHTSYWHSHHGGLRKANTFIEYSKRLVDDSLYEAHIPDKQKLVINEITKHINCISYYDSIVVFEKFRRVQPFHIRKGAETIEPYIPELNKPSLLLKIKSRLRKSLDTFKDNDRGRVEQQ